MSAPDLTAADWADLASAAEPVDPRKPERRLEIPRTSRSWLFELDRDLAKLVRLEREGQGLRIAVLYFTDAVIEQDSATIPLDPEPSLSVDAMGIVVEWRQPVLHSLGWPLIRRRRRF